MRILWTINMLMPNAAKAMGLTAGHAVSRIDAEYVFEDSCWWNILYRSIDNGYCELNKVFYSSK